MVNGARSALRHFDARAAGGHLRHNDAMRPRLLAATGFMVCALLGLQAQTPVQVLPTPAGADAGMYSLTTAADTFQFVDAIKHPACGMMWDTFHAHIEEKNTPAALESIRQHLVHVHISENDRGTPGTVQVRWAETFATLQNDDVNLKKRAEEAAEKKAAFGEDFELEKFEEGSRVSKPIEDLQTLDEESKRTLLQ